MSQLLYYQKKTLTSRVLSTQFRYCVRFSKVSKSKRCRMIKKKLEIPNLLSQNRKYPNPSCNKKDRHKENLRQTMEELLSWFQSDYQVWARLTFSSLNFSLNFKISTLNVPFTFCRTTRFAMILFRLTYPNIQEPPKQRQLRPRNHSLLCSSKNNSTICWNSAFRMARISQLSIWTKTSRLSTSSKFCSKSAMRE